MKRILWKTVAVLTLVSFAGAVGACGDSELDNQEENQNQEQNQNQDDPPFEPGEYPSSCDDPADDYGLNIPSDYEAQALNDDYDMRLTEFVFRAGSPGGAALNSIIPIYLEDQSHDYPIVVLLELRSIDADAGAMQIRGGAGLKVDNEGTYEWDDELLEPELEDGEIHESGAAFARLSLLNFVATIETEDAEPNKTIIPIRDLDFNALLEVDSSGETPEINEGMLTGVVVADEVEDVRISLNPGSGSGASLAQVLGGDSTMNFDYNCDGEPDSWFLSADIKAAETVIVD